MQDTLSLGIAARSIAEDDDMSDTEDRGNPGMGWFQAWKSPQTRAGTSRGRTRSVWSIVFQKRRAFTMKSILNTLRWWRVPKRKDGINPTVHVYTFVRGPVETAID